MSAAVLAQAARRALGAVHWALGRVHWALGRIRRALGRVHWFIREVSGESGYDRYLAHTYACDPEAEVLTRREFERRRTDAREADPREGFGCC